MQTDCTCIEPLMTQEQLAELFGVTIYCVRKWRQRGQIPFIRVGQTVRFHHADVAAFIEAHYKTVPTPAA